MKQSVKFIKDHSIEIDGKKVRFRTDQVTELEESLALELFRKGIVLPGIQHSKPRRFSE